MHCYVDAKNGVDAQAVAVCNRCGMGLCLSHAHELRVPGVKVPEQDVARGAGFLVSVPAMLVFCEQCSAMYEPPSGHAGEAAHAR